MGLPFLAGYLLGGHGRQSARLASVASTPAGAQRDDVYALHDRIDRLILVVAAMWSLLEEQGMDEQALLDRIRQIDESDGFADGKLTAASAICSKCGARVAAGLPACQFCGTEVPGAGDPFAQV